MAAAARVPPLFLSWEEVQPPCFKQTMFCPEPLQFYFSRGKNLQNDIFLEMTLREANLYGCWTAGACCKFRSTRRLTSGKEKTC
jgi:hypothetical protein